MPPQVIVPRSMRIGEIFTVLLGFGLATLAIGARTYTKLRITRKFLSEDYFCFAGYLGLVAYLGLALVIGRNGGNAQHKAYLSMVETIVYDPTIVFVKISILLQYVTLFVAHRRNLFHYAVHFLLWVNVIFYVAITFQYIFQCKPRQKLWIPQTPGHCSDAHGRGVFSGSINVASDFLIFLLPLPILLRLQMPSTKKYRLLFVFGFGFFACVASVVRLVYSIQLNPNAGPVEFQLTMNKEGLWAFAEISIGIIVGCMPLVHKCFTHISSKFATTSSLRILPGGSGGSSWRRLFRKSSSSEASASQKFFGSKDSGSSKDSGTTAPQIRTLQMTRASFSSTGGELASAPPLTEKALPRTPSPVHDGGAKSRKPMPEAAREEEYIPEKIKDEESVVHDTRSGWTTAEETQATTPTPSWPPQYCTEQGRRNETKRAQYDLYPET